MVYLPQKQISIEIDGTSDDLLRLVCGSCAITGTTSITNGEWHHMAVVITDDSSPSIDEVKIYVDGVDDNATSGSTQSINTGTDNTFLIGRDFNNTAKDWNGSLDDIRVYNTDLTATQFLQIYNEGRR